MLNKLSVSVADESKYYDMLTFKRSNYTYLMS